MRTTRRVLWLVALLVLAGTVPWTRPMAAQAQACSPRPQIIVDQHTDGWVGFTATGGNVLSQIAITSDPHYVGSQTNVVVDLPGHPPGLTPGFSVPISPPAASYTLQVHSLTPGVAATLPVTVTDNCGPWQTFVGGGTANTFPTALPSATPTIAPTVTRTPTPAGPTRTATPLPVVPTSTPLTSPQDGFGPPVVYQGGSQVWTVQGRTNPTTTDYLVLTDSNGAYKGPPLYTSSCTSTPGSIAKSSVACNVTFSANFPAGTYQLRLYAQNTGTLLATQPNDQVAVAGAAVNGRGQEWGTTSIMDDEQVAFTGGFIGDQAFISVPDPSYQSQFSWYHVGLNSIGNFSGNFIEAGVVKQCDPYNLTCAAHPYMSWVDNRGVLTYIPWDGRPSFGPNGYYPNMSLSLNLASDQLYKVYEVSATTFEGMICDQDQCCPLYLDGLPCRAMGIGDSRPVTLQTHYAQVFAGTETLTPAIAGGSGDIGWPSFCCRWNVPTWIGVDCYDHEWRELDASRVIGLITDCQPPFSGWGVQTFWR